jgi:hypothetical protein
MLKSNSLNWNPFSFAQTLRSPNFRTVDTVLVATTRWNSSVSDSLLSQKNADFKNMAGARA